MDMRLVPVDQQVTVALSTSQQVLHLSDKGLPLCGIGTGYRGYGSRALGGAEDGIQFGCDAQAKEGRPPVRR